MNDSQQLAAQLLDAHVAHQLEQLRGPHLALLIEREVEALFAWLAGVKLNDIVTREYIVGLISRYVIDLQISGAFAELSGEMSRLVVSSRASEHTRVDEVLRPESFTQFADKVAALEGLWRTVVHLVLQSNAYATLVSRTFQRGLLDGIIHGEHRTPPQHSRRGDLLNRLRPLIQQRIEPYVSAYLETFIKRVVRRGEQRLVVALDPEAVRALIDEVWDAIAPMRLSEAFAFISTHDLEDFVVLIYEFWQRYRKTPYFREISSELVDHFFDKYGDGTVLSLLDDLNIIQDMVTKELQILLGTVLSHASTTGFLEARLRAHLAPFYQSSAAAEILGKA
jgi:hypothetical protein